MIKASPNIGPATSTNNLFNNKPKLGPEQTNEIDASNNINMIKKKNIKRGRRILMRFRSLYSSN